MTNEWKKVSNFALVGMILGSLVVLGLLVTPTVGAAAIAPANCNFGSVRSVQNGCCDANSEGEVLTHWDQWYCDYGKGKGNETYWRSIGSICAGECDC